MLYRTNPTVRDPILFCALCDSCYRKEKNFFSTTVSIQIILAVSKGYHLTVPPLPGLDLEFWSFAFLETQHKCPPDFVNANKPKDDYVLSSGLVKLLLN